MTHYIYSEQRRPILHVTSYLGEIEPKRVNIQKKFYKVRWNFLVGTMCIYTFDTNDLLDRETFIPQ